jgi:hypothetical protein
VAHAELVEVLTNRLAERGLAITGEKLAVSANGMQIFVALDFGQRAPTRSTRSLHRDGRC